MISLKFKVNEEKYKILLMVIFLIAACLLTYYFHAVLNRGTVFSHIFYIPIILASLWWKRKGLIVAIFLAVLLTLSHIYIRVDVVTTDDYFRAIMFMIVAVVASMLSEHIEKTENALRESEEKYRTTFENTGTAMSIGEEDTTISMVNKMYEKLSGYSKEEIEGKKRWTEFVAKEDLEKMVGRGTGIDEEGLMRKRNIINSGIQVNQPDRKDGLDILSKVGGFEIGGIAGCMLAGAYHNRPVMVDGFISTAGALIAHTLCPHVTDYLFAGHCSEEPGHRAMLEHLKLEPILDLGMRLGEGTGGALSMGIIEGAIQVFNNVLTFEEAGVSEKEI